MDLIEQPPPPAWLALPALAALTGSFTFRIPGSVVRLTVAEPIIFTATLLYGPAAGTFAAAVDAIAMSLRLVRQLRTPHRFLFNVALLSIALWPSSTLFFFLTGLDPHQPHYGGLETFVWPLYLFAAGVFLTNSSLLAIALAIERGSSAFTIWRNQFSWVSASYFASASLAALLVVYAPVVNVAFAAALAPLLLVSYLVFKTTVGRLDDANKHLGEVNSLYLSTIETLAMAIDAKDQVTHGHIRRVQRYAVGLAASLGVDDDRQLRAIEAAALLHDMGKLAIPEFILNKPSKLTATEFDVMKTHAAVGADILSAIQFPYPVVPIVRYHHENWDGTGYPEGLKGPTIPIGARVLSVVDCYDALTSDRPYRPAMTDLQAIEILVQRRGRMYDPLVVDTFVREHSRLKAQVEQEDLASIILSKRQVDSPSPAEWQPLSSSISQEASYDSLRLLASIAPFPAGPPLNVLCGQLAGHLRSIAQFETAVFFAPDESALGLCPVFADGPGAQVILAARVPMAEQLTGWVAAHRTAVWNSDAALDIAAATANVGLELASSMPLCADDSIVGVLTLYGKHGHDITASQRRTIETVLGTASAAMATALNLPQWAVDCRRHEVRTAALSAVDSLLSHDKQQVGRLSMCVVVALTLRPVTSDRHGIAASGSGDALTMFLTRLSSTTNRVRVALCLSSSHALLCSFDGTPAEVLAQEARQAVSQQSLQHFEVLTTTIRSPLELQDGVRRVLETAESGRSSAALPVSRIH